MNSEFFEAVKALAQEKNISTEYLFEKIETALAAAMRKNYGGNNKEREVVKCKIDTEKHTIKIWAELEVVEEITEPGAQILLEDAKRLDKDAALGAFVIKPIELSEYGRIAAQTAKHVIRQGIREAERSRQIEEFRSKKQEIVSAKVARIDPVKGNVSLEIAGGDAVLPKKEQVPGETFYEGQHIQVYIVDVRDDERGSKVMISRTHPGFVRRLFEREVPEIFEGTVEIKSVSREAGSRTKIAVYSADEDVDPVGACIGPKGGRVNTIVDVLGGEKIDVIRYDEDPHVFIKEALTPAKVKTVVLTDVEKREAIAIVPEDQFSFAIGKSGLNVRLANRLCNWNIDVKTESQAAEMEIVEDDNSRKAAESLFAGMDQAVAAQEEEIASISHLPGIDSRVAEILKAAGLDDIGDFVDAVENDKVKDIEGLSAEDIEAVNKIIDENVEFEDEDGAVNGEEAESQEEEEYFCPECGAKISLNDTRCPKCGIELAFE